jgi:hypothetical protein
METVRRRKCEPKPYPKFVFTNISAHIYTLARMLSPDKKISNLKDIYIRSKAHQDNSTGPLNYQDQKEPRPN